MRQIFKIYEAFPCQHFRYPFTGKYGIIELKLEASGYGMQSSGQNHKRGYFLCKKHSVMKVVLDTLVFLIRDSFIPAFAVLEKTLKEKLEEAESDWA